MTKLRQLLQKRGYDKRRLVLELCFLAVSIAAILIVLSPVLRNAGWPQNHEGLAFFDRTAIYADHIRQGDIFPIWSSSDAFGMGTPLPLFYHKTFYAVSSVLFILFGSMKFAIFAAVAFFMLVGVYGMRLCMQRFTHKKWLLFLVPQALLLANYTFTDWLIRGAMAEFTAMMLLPWLFWWCLVLVTDKRFSLWIVPIMLLLFHAHNITAVYAVFALLIAYGIFLGRAGIPGLKRTWKKTVLAVVLLGALLAPQLLLQKAFLSDYDPSKITQAGFLASENFREPGDYFMAEGYTWLKTWEGLMVQFDYTLWVPLLLAVIAWIIFLVRRYRQAALWSRKEVINPICLFLVLSLTLYVLLQFEFAKSVYTTLDPLEYLQFPWRLLAYITPLAILLVGYIISRLPYGRAVQVGVVVWLAVFFILSPLPQRFQYIFIPPSLAQALLTASLTGTGGTITGIGEYLPKVYIDNKQMSSLDTLKLYRSYYFEERRAETLEGTCTITQEEPKRFEPLKQTFQLDCDGPAVVALPISYSRFAVVHDERKNNDIEYFRNQEDPRILVRISESTKLTVSLPTIRQVLTQR